MWPAGVTMRTIGSQSHHVTNAPAEVGDAANRPSANAPATTNLFISYDTSKGLLVDKPHPNGRTTQVPDLMVAARGKLICETFHLPVSARGAQLPPAVDRARRLVDRRFPGDHRARIRHAFYCPFRERARPGTCPFHGRQCRRPTHWG